MRFDRLDRAELVWRVLRVLLSLGVISIACAVLWRQLEGVEVAQVLVALKATKLRNVGIAACLVVACYVSLTFYDFLALRALGFRSINYRTAALAGFAGYAIGHNVGASTLVAGIVRYRIYS